MKLWLCAWPRPPRRPGSREGEGGGARVWGAGRSCSGPPASPAADCLQSLLLKRKAFSLLLPFPKVVRFGNPHMVIVYLCFQSHSLHARSMLGSVPAPGARRGGLVLERACGGRPARLRGAAPGAAAAGGRAGRARRRGALAPGRRRRREDRHWHLSHLNQSGGCGFALGVARGGRAPAAHRPPAPGRAPLSRDPRGRAPPAPLPLDGAASVEDRTDGPRRGPGGGGSVGNSLLKRHFIGTFLVAG